MRRRQTIRELLAELRVLDRTRKAINAELDQAIANYGTCLTEMDGIGHSERVRVRSLPIRDD